MIHRRQVLVDDCRVGPFRDISPANQERQDEGDLEGQAVPHQRQRESDNQEQQAGTTVCADQHRGGTPAYWAGGSDDDDDLVSASQRGKKMQNARGRNTGMMLHDPSPHVVGDGRIHHNPMLIFQNSLDPGQKTVDSLRERRRVEHRE
jgi:hypothetical protein